MTTLDKTARTAGLLYLVVVLTGIFSLAYVPSQITMHGEASAIASSVADSKQLFRLGIVASCVCYTAFLMLPFALYRLLRPVGRNAAVLMVAFAVASVPISFVNLLNKLNALSVLTNAGNLQGFTTQQVEDMVMLSLDAYGNGLLISELFWGLWLLPFGYLVFKSGFIPKVLGILLMAGCFGYLIDFFASVLVPGYADTIAASIATKPAALGEIGICLWLLVFGARDSKTPVVMAEDAV